MANSKESKAQRVKIKPGEKYSGEEGVVIAGYSDPSYNDIQIQLDSGRAIWRSRLEVEFLDA
ncbi:hypothetical protein [Neptuniibacter sp. QD37_11]|uniref:hypothetical protein n=1 Tax=Neptuniibacter sp. QD37_11 TaxID=3398209 RepID=UPI0039F5CC1B